MTGFDGYEAAERAWERAGFATYRARQRDGGAPVWIVRAEGAESTPEDHARLRRDYEIAASLEPDAVVRALELSDRDGRPALVLEDDGSRPLAQQLGTGPSNPDAFLTLAIELARAVERIQEKNIIHKNLNPDTIWVDPGKQRVKLTGFGVASRTPHDGQGARGRIDGWLPYVSPEQTGRMNRNIDHRVDHYSLGVVLYQLLTGRLPFESRDPLELIHCHLALQPPSPTTAAPDALPIVCEIVMKLLAKTPEERYQRASALRVDLEECLSQWRAQRAVVGIVPGARDAHGAFHIPQNLYGRESELKQLETAFERAASGVAELVLVTGEPGIGKSALVQEMQRPAASRRGYFISGKFDQYKRNVPYSALIQAFQELVRQLLGERAERVARWRDDLLAALGENVQIVIDVIPGVELITGPQPPVHPLPPAEGRNRFIRVFRDFVHVFATEEHPLAIFLDDLQWTDLASLTLLEELVTDPATGHMLLVAAYRDTEVDPGHPLSFVFDDLDDHVKVTSIALRPLGADDVNRLVSDTFHCEPGHTLALAHLVHGKTGGNPFFVSQFLQHLVSEGLIDFDAEDARWRWDLGRIQERGITDNVIELMSAKLTGLAPETREALMIAACVGNSFDLQTLTLLSQWPVERLRPALHEALREGLIVAPADGYHLADDTGLSSETRAEFPSDVVLRFLHDRVQQAAYAFIPEEERVALHVRFGRLLRESMSEQELEDAPFDVVNHLNPGREQLASQPERDDLALLNLSAARKARASAAYGDALEHLRISADLLAADAWHTSYQLAFDVHCERLECEYQGGHPEEADQLFRLLLENVKTPIERAQVYYTKILVETNRDRNEEAIRAGLEALAHFGIRLPEHPSRARLLAAVARVRLRVGRKTPAVLAALPPLSDPERHAAMRLLMSICPAAYFTNPNLMTLAALRIVDMTLRHGTAPPSPYGYILYALVLGAVLGDYERGHAFGRLADEMSARDDDVLLRCKVLFIFVGLVNFWRRPIETSIEGTFDAFKASLDAGDIQYATYSMQFLIQFLLFKGTPLAEVYGECARLESMTLQTRDVITISTLRFRQHVIRRLQGARDETREELDEDESIASARARGNLTGVAYQLIPRLQVEYLLGNYAEARTAAEESEAALHGVPSQAIETEHHFYRGLLAAALLRTAPRDARSLRRRLARSVRLFARWARHQAENFGAQAALLEAELSSVRGRDQSATSLYGAAIEAASKSEMLHVEALANELAARHHLAAGRNKVARTHLVDARRLYRTWGAEAKVRLLDDEFGTSEHDAPARPSEAPVSATDSLDLDSVMKANQAIASETDMARLLGRLMEIALENAGARRGSIALVHDGELRVEASASVEKSDLAGLLSQRVEECDDVFAEVVNFVARSHNDLVLQDAQSDPRFRESPHVKAHGLRSVLCTAIVKQGELVGVLYLENELAPGVFTPGRVETLRMISSAVANVIDNTRLYGQLRENREALFGAQAKVELLEKAKQHLVKFVPQSVQRLIDENPDAPELERQEQDVSVLFLDIAGYTKLSDELDVEQVSYLVERYFSSYLDDIHRNGGDINETLGDGLMILFHDPDPGVHAKRAARTAIAIQAKTLEINADLEAPYEPVIVNLGINSGIAAVGSTRLEGVTGIRHTYTATGAVTNIAARLGDAAEDGTTLVSAETARRISTEFALEDIGELRLKNVAEPLRTHRLLHPI
jgi:histidine kinase